MDAADAAECAAMINCKTIVGVHYDTFGYIVINHEEAIRKFSEKNKKLTLIAISKSIEI